MTYYKQKKVKTDVILSMININTRYIFADVVSTYDTGKIVRDADTNINEDGFLLENVKTVKKKKSENQEIEDSYKSNNKNRLYSKSSALQTANALGRILDSVPEERENLSIHKFLREEAIKDTIKELKEQGEEIPKNIKLPPGEPDIDIDRIFVDEGSEFKAEFNKKCMDEGIKLYVFKKQEGAKRRLGIIERSHRIVRTLLQKGRAAFPKMSYTELLPIVLDEYNYNRDHRILRKFFNRNNNRDKSRGPLDWAERGSLFTPSLMHDPGREDQYVDWMKEKEEETDKHYKEDMKEILNPNKEVKYYKRYYERAWKDTKNPSTVSKRRKVMGIHKYQWKRKNPRTGKLTVKNMTGKSVKLEGEKSRFMPYELRVYDKNKRNKIL